MTRTASLKLTDLLTRRQLAPVMGVHMQTICKWEQDGMPVAQRGRKGKPSLYREQDVRGWLATREEAASKGGIVDVAQERARKERAQAMLAEQMFKTRAKQLLPADEVRRIWTAEVTAVRTKLLALPQASADQIARAATLHGVAGVENAVREAVYDVLRELSDSEREPSPSAPDDDGQRAAA